MGKLPTYFPHNVFSFRLRALPTRPTPEAEMDLLKRSRHLYVTFTDYLRPSVKLVSRVQIKSLLAFGALILQFDLTLRECVV